MRRRARSRSAPCRFMITGWLPLNLSATSCASLNEIGVTTWGFTLDATGMGRTTWGRGVGTMAGGAVSGESTVRMARTAPMAEGSGASGTLHRRSGGPAPGARVDVAVVVGGVVVVVFLFGSEPQVEEYDDYDAAYDATSTRPAWARTLQCAISTMRAIRTVARPLGHGSPVRVVQPDFRGIRTQKSCRTPILVGRTSRRWPTSSRANWPVIMIPGTRP